MTYSVLLSFINVKRAVCSMPRLSYLLYLVISCTFYNSLVSGPCPPTNVQVSLQCVGNVGHVTWNAAPHADLYVATAKPSALDQHEYNCSSNGTSCSLTDLHCGETATVTVVTMERGCMSKPSSPITFHSG